LFTSLSQKKGTSINALEHCFRDGIISEIRDLDCTLVSKMIILVRAVKFVEEKFVKDKFVKEKFVNLSYPNLT